MLFYEFQEFVSYPLDPERVGTRSERLDISKAFRRGPDGKYPPDFDRRTIAGIIDFGMIVDEGDTFECMEVTDYGEVLIWTQQKVWLLLRKETGGRLEKLIYVPRHPPQNTA